MSKLESIKHTLRKHKPELARRYRVREVGVFGSYVRDEQRPDSDIDILIDLDDDARLDLFDLVRLEDELSDLLGADVDIALKRNLRKRIGQRIISEVQLV